MNHTVLVANRGEVAIRVMRAIADLGWSSVAVASADDGDCLHVQRADRVATLAGRGPAAYLDVEAVVDAASEAGATVVHPGYGFLAESSELAEACGKAGLIFVGPSPDTLRRLGDKVEARRLAAGAGVPVAAGTDEAVDLDGARAFMAALPPGTAVLLKAVNGGGGRGLRRVSDPAELADAFARARSEASAAFGSPDLYVEQAIGDARHVEVQVVADEHGSVTHLGERDCSIQRRHQKLIEMAPAVGLDDQRRAGLADAALRVAGAAGLSGLATVEFLVPLNPGPGVEAPFFFIEVNPRLQVEHTVTEEITGVDLVTTQLRLAAGAGLAEVGLVAEQAPQRRGVAVQARVNAEHQATGGATVPSGGALDVFDVPTGPGIRVDTHGYAGYAINPAFDSLLAKVIAWGSDGVTATSRLRRALGELRVEGTEVNDALLATVLDRPEVAAGRATTTFFDQHQAELAATAGSAPRREPAPELVEGITTVTAPMPGTVIDLPVGADERLAAGTVVAVMEAMKMEHTIATPAAGTVAEVAVAVGDTVVEGQALVRLTASEELAPDVTSEADVDLDHVRADLAEVLERQRLTRDEARPEAVERRRRHGQRTARENLADLCDPGTFQEYGSLAIAAQRARRELEELIRRTPADGLIAGIGRVNGDRFTDDRARCAVLSYDYTVLAGTQGLFGHQKKDRLFEIIERLRLPVVLFAEGGGGRPGDTDQPMVAGLDCRAFAWFGRLSGLVPTVGIVSGRCFAGNAALLGCCDVIIATENASIGMGGPAMIEGGGLGVFDPDEVGPLSVQVPNGVVDVAVADEAEAVAVAKQYLAYFQGATEAGPCADQRLLRHAVPENRKRVYDVRRVLHTVADTGSVLELRPRFGTGMVTALVRLEGRPVGVIANDPRHLGGAIDSPGADKATRFMALCDAFDLPLVFLCDTPGFMVGPEAERSAQVRHFSRMFVTGTSLTVPFCTVVLRKGYGLGAQAMAGGGFHEPLFTVAWPTGEFGGMGLEGAVRLGFRRELEAAGSEAERQALFDRLVEAAYQRGKALNMASYFEIDDVIDPADTRRRIVDLLRSARPAPVREGKKRPCVDTW